MDRELAPKEYFYLLDGRFLTNTNDLIAALKTMADETFLHHVNNQRNDFANWIKDVFENEELAKKISTIKDKEKMRKEIQYELTRHHARKFLQSANYFAKKQELKEEKNASEPLAEQKNPSINKKVDEMLKREQDIREQEELIKKKIESEVHKYFNPYESPYDAYIAFMNIMHDLQMRLKEKNRLSAVVR